MEYQHAERDFVERTSAVVNQYEEYVLGQVPEAKEYEVTLLINCLLGLLVIVRESYLNEIEMLPMDTLGAWGLSEHTVCEWGTHDPKRPKEEQKTLREFVRRLRNGAAHHNVTVVGNGRE